MGPIPFILPFSWRTTINIALNPLDSKFTRGAGATCKVHIMSKIISVFTLLFLSTFGVCHHFIVSRIELLFSRLNGRVFVFEITVGQHAFISIIGSFTDLRHIGNAPSLTLLL